MLVHKIAFKIDFNLAHKVFNAPGELIKLIAAAENGFFNDFQENQGEREITGVARSDDKSLKISIKPNHIYFVYECLEGISPKEIATHPEFILLCNTAESLRRFVEVKEVARIGMRFWCYHGYPVTHAAMVNAFEKLLLPEFQSLLNKRVGKPQDFGIYVDGIAEDDIAYKLHFGPYHSNEAKKFINSITKVFELKSENYNSLTDIDFYELDVGLELGINSWCKPIINKFNGIIPEQERLMNGLIK